MTTPHDQSTPIPPDSDTGHIDTSTAAVERLAAITFERPKFIQTHWPGCESTHMVCALHRLADVAVALSIERDALRAERYALRAHVAKSVEHRTTLVDAEYKQALEWRDAWLAAAQDDLPLPPMLDPQIVAYLVADAEDARQQVAARARRK